MIEPGQDKDFEKAIELSKQTAAQEENDFGDEELERALKISMVRSPATVSSFFISNKRSLPFPKELSR